LVVLLASLLRLLASLGQGWVLARGMADGGESLGTWLALYSAAVMLFALASAVGLALLGWGALRAISAAGARAARRPAAPVRRPRTAGRDWAGGQPRPLNARRCSRCPGPAAAGRRFRIRPHCTAGEP